MASDTLTPWSADKAIPYQIANQSTFIDGETINIIAGSTFSAISNISFSRINNDGSLSDWNNSINFPISSYWHTISKNNGFVYVIGGTTYPPANSTNLVYMGTISNETITEWKQINPLTTPKSMANSTIVNNKIYVLGGFNMTNGAYTSFSNEVVTANILADGTIGEWTATSSLPKKIFGFGLITINNKIIVIGGRDESNTSVSSIYEANILENGQIDTWVEIGKLPQPIANAGVINANNTIFVVGGVNISSFGQVNWLNTIYYASLNNDGSVENWNISQFKLPKTICCGSIIASNDNLYLLGGYDGISGAYINDVYKSTFLKIPIPNPFPSLNVPDIKQYSPPWNLQIYDHADLWSKNPSIQSWGCALTSADMILQYYGFLTDPEALNTWLKNEPDGYIRNGLLNWIAISRYSKLNSNETNPSLEFQRLDGNNNNLINELNSGRPAILEEPGHFVVAKAQNQTTFDINDPAFSDRSTLSSYNNLFNSIETFTPSHTDLSYIMLILNPEFDMKIFDTKGEEINNKTFTENPLTDDSNTSTVISQPIKIFELPKPQNGKYIIKISGNGIYQLDSYLYDLTGNVNLTKTKGILGSNQTDELILTIGEINSTKINPSIEQIINDWTSTKEQGMIKSDKIYQQIKSTLKIISILIKNNQIKLAKIWLFATNQIIKAYTHRFIDKSASDIIQVEISSLIKSL